MRWTMTRVTRACLLVAAALMAALVWILLSAWQRSIAATADSLQQAAIRRATELVEGHLGHLRAAVADVEFRSAAGVCRFDDRKGVRACLVGNVAADGMLAEASFTSAAGWQASAYREAGDATPCHAAPRRSPQTAGS
jgi:hypothetical protein